MNTNERITTVYAKVGNPKLGATRVSCLKPGGNQQGICINCNTTLNYYPTYETIQTLDNQGCRSKALACSFKCAQKAGWFPPIKFKEPKEPNEPTLTTEAPTLNTQTMPTPNKEPKPNCLICNGPPKGRGHTHTNECPKNTTKKAAQCKARQEVKPNCPECNGTPARRGWTHTNECQYNKKRTEQKYLEKYGEPKPTKPSCPECNGKAMGLGWTHKPDCELKRRASLERATQARNRAAIKQKNRESSSEQSSNTE